MDPAEEQRVSDLEAAVELLNKEMVDLYEHVNDIEAQVGPQGKQGPIGPKGDTGDPGKSIIGPRGLPGKDGIDGKDGKDVDVATVEELRSDIERIAKTAKGGVGNYPGQQWNVNSSILGIPYRDVNIIAPGATVTTDAVHQRMDVTLPTGGGTPASPDTSVQFNDGGSFGGQTSFLFDKNTRTIFLGLEGGGNTGTLRTPNASSADTDASPLQLFSGNGLGTGWGGDINIGSNESGNGGDTGTGGTINVKAGSGGATSGSGGSISLIAGNAQGGDSNGGSFQMSAGGAAGSGTGGVLNFSSGDAAFGGAVIAMDAATSTDASSIRIEAGGNGDLGDFGGGTVTISGGRDDDGNHQKDVLFQPFGGSVKIGNPLGINVVLDTSLISSSDKTFTFPDVSGTFITNNNGSPLTKTDDTNITLALGGSPTTALVNATSLTLGWTGQLSVARGGTGSSTLLGAGIPTKTSNVTATAQTADIGSTNLTTTGAGLYRLAYYLVDSTADLTAGAVRLNITYTDNGASQTQQSATVALTILGTFTQGQFIIQLASGNIAYSTTHTGIFGSAKYDLFITLERLN